MGGSEGQWGGLKADEGSEGQWELPCGARGGGVGARWDPPGG